MENSKAFDLPIRIFHWVFALLFITSFTIAKVIDDESSLYVYHMLSGLLMVFLVLFRVIWGFVGSKTSRFSSYQLNPSEMVSYFRSVISTNSKRYLGHNPASSYAAVLMMLFALGLGFSGLMMSLRINKHFFEDIHELLANGFLIMVIFHIAGVLLHHIRHNDGMIFSMFNGKKAKVDGESDIKSNHKIVAFIFVIFIVAMGSYLLKNFDGNSGKLNAFGVQLQLAENEHGDHSGEHGYYSKSEDDDHDEDDD